MQPIDPTTQSLRLAMGMSLAQAEVASSNIARASTDGALADAPDFGAALGLLEQAVRAGDGADASLARAIDAAAASMPGAGVVHTTHAINLDEQVADLAGANLRYQTLSESMSRHFGLLRLAITGRS